LIVTQRPDASLFNNDIPQFTQCTAPPMPYFCTVTNTTTTAATNVFYRINWDTLSNPTPFTSNNSWSSQVYTYPTGYSFLQYIVQGINGCVDTARYSVFNGQNPSLGLNSLGSTNGCTNGTSCFSFSVFGSSPDLTYIVDWDDGTIEHYGGINPPLPDPLTHCYTTSSCSKPGAGYFLKVTATNPCSYSQSTYGPIHISAPPSSQFIDPWLHCPNQPLTFINTSETGCYITGGVAYYKANFRWIIDNVIISEVFNTSVPPNLTISLSSGQHNVCLESWNQCNGSGDHSIECHTICVDPQPQASFSLPAPAEGCKPYTVTVTNTSSDINSPLDNPCNTLQYTWTVTNIIGSPNCLPQASAISWSFALGSDLHSQHPTFIFNDAGSYQINLTVQNGCGSQTISHTVTVNQPPNVSINASSLGSTCPGEPLFPTATVDNCWGTAAYNWLFPEGTPINSSLPNPVVTYSTPGVKLITLEVGNSCGIGTDTKSAFVQASPVPTINGEDAVCLGQYYIYTTEPGMSNYLWNLMGGITLGGTTSNSISVIWVGPAAIISVSYSNGCNAPTSTSMIVDIFPPLMGDVFLSDTIIGNGQTACFAHQKITTGSVNEPFTVQTGGMANLFGSDWVKLWPGTVVHQGGRLTVSIANNCIPCSIFQTFSGNQPYNQDNNENITVSSLMPAQFLRLYPNPTSGKFMIEMKNDGENLATQIRIFNMMGNVVFEQSIREGIFKQELSLDNQAPGIYYVKVIRGDESTILKLVKTR
jgi:PKD repeat protein